MLYYFDSSAAVKRYATEKGSEWVKSIVEPTKRNTVCLAQVGIVEIAAALSKKVRTKELSEEDYEAALWLFLSDVRNEEYIITPLSDKVMEAGVDLTRRHPLRGYDAIQLATAIILRNALIRTEELSLFIFVSADNALCEAARSEGLPADNPDEH